MHQSVVPGPPAFEFEAHLRLKRRGFAVSAGVLLLSLAAHPLLFGAFVPEVGLVHLGWAALLVTASLVAGSSWMPLQRASTLSGVFSLAAIALDIHFTGGLSSPLFPLLFAMPLIIAVFTPGDLLTLWATIVLTLVGVVAATWLSGGSERQAIGQVTVFLFMAWIAVFSGKMFHRMRDAERAAVQERLAALEQLARSERLRVDAERSRAEMERLALVGRLAAGVAHEVNNPLAYVKSNLGYLGDVI